MGGRLTGIFCIRINDKILTWEKDNPDWEGIDIERILNERIYDMKTGENLEIEIKCVLED